LQVVWQKKQETIVLFTNKTSQFPKLNFSL
jgi:hypothetical protein